MAENELSERLRQCELAIVAIQKALLTNGYSMFTCDPIFEHLTDAVHAIQAAYDLPYDPYNPVESKQKEK